MPRQAKLRWTLRALAAPLALSLSAHGLLLLALWFWPTPSRRPSMAITDTRIVLDACQLDLDSAANPRGLDLSGYLRGPDVTTEPPFQPRLVEAPADMGTTIPSTAPIGHTGGAKIPAAIPGSPAGGGHSGEGSGGAGGMFALPPAAAKVVYVLDRSVSMGERDRLDRARRELLASLRGLPPGSCFQVIAYNTNVEPLVIDHCIDLLPADPVTIDRVAREVEKLTASGGTDHAKALLRGLSLHPDVLFFVTDADDLPLDQVAAITRCNQGAAIHAIELTRRRKPRPDGPLAQLARCNGGTYRCIPLGD